MFFDSDYTWQEMVLIWLIVMSVWGLSLALALKLAQVELKALELVVLMLISGLVALIPFIGPYLGLALVIYLINRMADSHLGIIIAVVLISRFIAAVIAILIERALVHFGLL
jgi:hypothetical protein